MFIIFFKLMGWSLGFAHEASRCLMTHLVLSCKFNCVSKWCAEDGNGIVRHGICFCCLFFGFYLFLPRLVREIFIFNFCADLVLLKGSSIAFELYSQP